MCLVCSLNIRIMQTYRTKLSYFFDKALALSIISTEQRQELSANDNVDVEVSKFIIPVADIFTEVRKRTTYLAKLRGLDIDNFALTADEDDIYQTFYNEIVSSVAECFEPFARYTYITHLDKFPSLLNPSDPNYTDNKLIFFAESKSFMQPAQIDNKVFEAVVSGIMYKWIELAIPQEAQNYYFQYDHKKKELTAALNTSGPYKHRYIYF